MIRPTRPSLVATRTSPRRLGAKSGAGHLLATRGAGGRIQQQGDAAWEHYGRAADAGEAADYIAARMDIGAPLEQLSPEARLARELEIIAEKLPEMRLRLAAYLRQKTAGFGVLN